MCNNILWSMEKQQITMVVILDLSAAFVMVDHNILFNILQNHYKLQIKPYNGSTTIYSHSASKAWVRNNYSRPQQLHFSVHLGSYSVANIFTCYSAIIDKVKPDDIIINGFVIDHLLRKSFPA